MQKTNQKKFGVKKVIKTKGDKLYVKWKGYDSSFNGWIDKKDINEWIFSKTEIFSRKSESWIRFNYATKENLKNATDVDTSDFTKKTDLANLKSDADKVDRTWQIARMQRARKEVFACTKLRARKSIKTPLSSTLILFKVASCFCV